MNEQNLIGRGFYKDERNGLWMWQKMSKALALDCSVNTVGFATLQIQYDEEDDNKAFHWTWGMWELEGYNLLSRCRDLCNYIQQTGNDDFVELIIEWPMFYTSERGQIAASQNYTINLAAIGAYVAGFFHLPVDKITLITAPQWKGQASKNVTARRFFRQFNLEAAQIDHNAIDATMMLLAHAEKQQWLLPLC